MAKKQKENLSGFAWHTGYLKMQEGDEARHKSRCKYYVKDGKHCSIKNEHCIGSSHCKEYREEGSYTKEEKIAMRNEIAPIPKDKKLISIPCSIPMFDYIQTKNKQMGLFVRYKNTTMTLLVEGVERPYHYPYSFQDGYLVATPEIKKCIKNDLQKAVWK